jgi:UDP-glucose-4-epimerase GalE
MLPLRALLVAGAVFLPTSLMFHPLLAGPAVLVTGGAGYIGSHACKALKAAGFDPVVFDNLEEGERGRVQWGDLIVGDLRNEDQIRQALRQVQPCAVLHFAAYVKVGESVEKPGSYYRNNTFATLNLLDALQQETVDCPLIFSSTGAVYGTPEEVPTTESCRLAPESPYGASKAMAEQIIRDYHKAFGQRYCILRYFNACGADPDGDVGADPSKDTRLVAKAVQAFLDRGTLKVFGTDWPTPDGTCIRDYIHVSDLADAHVAALKTLLDRREESLTCNLGIGRGLSVLEVLHGLQNLIGNTLTIQLTSRRPGDIAVSIADNRLMRERLGFTPQHSSLAEILQTSTAWQRKRQQSQHAQPLAPIPGPLKGLAL